ncbi:FtsH protease activity modulator HflK [Bathymodiolus thermophilus thioautotrophic gill symbiont]|uniref:Protein HflK n=1 Tax=Bathymodiolus thermophilus thioautotrophic gill symbiont TaxID=2360 RepID=A0A8H8XE30_9GAMM|nr:FtsH protease activity modulator HflK [Bathymodiolus thermophilus thioautotrophic gill symbiont]CAB5497754.1 HflK protein [Bathymodiolus thermophilus thioautotrophic gill symbiont]
MAWNDDKKNPWGGNGQTPPELDEVIRDFKDKFSGIFGGKPRSNSNSEKSITPSAGGAKYIFIIGLLLWLASGVYIIDPAEKGVVSRFGAFQEETGQGPHWHFPYPIESLSRVNVEEIQDMQIGYRDAVRNRRGGNVSSESLMLTKGENMINAKFAVQYRINDAQAYLFNVANPKMTLRQVVESAIRQVVGKNSMDYVLTEGRVAIADSIKEKSQELLDVYQVGLRITTVNMQDAQPPEPVQAAFSDAVKAREDKQRLINEAQTYANDILPKSRGKAARILEESKAYKSKVVSKSEGEASRFKQILAEYTKAPKVTKERLYRETMENVLANTSKVLVDSKANSMMYLPIDKLLNNNAQPNKIVVQDSQSDQVRQGNSIRNVFRNREVR